MSKRDSVSSNIINSICNALFFRIVQRAIDKILQQAYEVRELEIHDTNHRKYIIMPERQYNKIKKPKGTL